MSAKLNQNPEQIARGKIDAMLFDAGWVVQSKNKVDLQAVKAISHINWLAAQIVLQVCTQSNHGLVNFQAHAVWKRKGHLW